MKRILVIGATSAIAEATARLWAAEGEHLFLLGRNEEKLSIIASDLKIRGAKSSGYALLDANDTARHTLVLDNAIEVMGGVDVVLIAYGTLGNQKDCERDFNLTLSELNTNAISVISLLTHLANHMEAQQLGTIAVISSVAGDRGRQSNYVYGTAKGAVTIFLQGLRNRLHKSGVRVLTIKPGFVDTPMTKNVQKGLLWATPNAVAVRIKWAIDKRRNQIYAPGFWAIIMKIIKSIPEPVFKRMSL